VAAAAARQVYNDQFVYTNGRYKMAGQWFALPKLLKSAESHGYQVVTNHRDLIQFRHEEVSTAVCT
jgi:7-keto-8-aminopelargonate synthetase-like enzyme